MKFAILTIAFFFSCFFTHADKQLKQYTNKFNSYVISEAEKLVAVYDNRIVTCKRKSHTKTVEVIEKKKNLLKFIITPLSSGQIFSDNFEVPISDPVLRDRLQQAFNLNEKDPILIKHIRGVESLDLSSNSQKGAIFNGGITDISPLKFFTSLKRLNLRKNSISDISAVSNLTKLIELDMSYNNVTDLISISNIKTLSRIFFCGNKITSLEPISKLYNLTLIDFLACEITDITPLENLNLLKDVNLRLNQVSDIKALTKLHRLRDLDLSSNKNITNIELIKECSKKIHTLAISDCGVDDLSVISHLTELKNLVVMMNKITDISPISNLTELKHLVAADNKITDLSPISHFSKLNTLNIKSNSIQDITPLSQMLKNGCFTGRRKFSYKIDISNNSLNLGTEAPNKPILDELLRVTEKINWQEGNKL